MNKDNKLYWILQISSWGLFATINILLFFYLNTLTQTTFTLSIIQSTIGLTITHGGRNLIKRYDLYEKPIFQMIGVGVAMVIGSSIAFLLLYNICWYFLDPTSFINFGVLYNIIGSVNSTILMLLWHSIYLLTQYFKRNQSLQIQNLQLEILTREAELNTLKSQLNPHFMFNALNSIRALILEDPQKAQSAVTLMSNILRYLLQLEGRKFVELSEELDIVKSYLNLESIRYEERLKVSISVDDELLSHPIPPLSLQILVENAIKHGISKVSEGGELKVKVFQDLDWFYIEVINPGSYEIKQDKFSTRVGVTNLIKRLKHNYRHHFAFYIGSVEQNMVKSEIKILKKAMVS